MKISLIGLFLTLININSYANENTEKYQYEKFLNSSDRGIYIKEQIDLNENFKDNKCGKVLKFTQISNDNLVLHLQVLCEGFDENLYLFLPKILDKDLIINTCSELKTRSNIKTKCGIALTK